jgi:HPt (histidine-containing phosphotransfer) domain-containing protein
MDEPPVDLAVALRQAGGDASLLTELVGIFLEDLAARVDALDQAASSGDTERVRFVAHALRGALAGLGARPAAAIAHELEARAGQGRTDDSREIFARLSRELDRLTAVLADPRWKEHLCGS